MTNRSKYPLALVAPAFLLASCGSDEPEAPPAPIGNSAEGEIAGGTISDTMPQLEQVRSTAPLAAPESAEVEGDSNSDDDAETEEAE